MHRGVGLLAAMLVLGLGVVFWHPAEAFFFCGAFSSGGGAHSRGRVPRPARYRPRPLPWSAPRTAAPVPVVRSRLGDGEMRREDSPRRNPWRVLVDPDDRGGFPDLPSEKTEELQQR